MSILSAIGRVGDSYSQNHKTLDVYYGAIDAGCMSTGSRCVPPDDC